MYAHATSVATIVGRYPAELMAAGNVSNPLPNAVPHSNAEEEIKLVLECAAELTILMTDSVSLPYELVCCIVS